MIVVFQTQICYRVSSKGVPVKALLDLCRRLGLRLERTDRRGPMVEALVAHGVYYIAAHPKLAGRFIGVSEDTKTIYGE